MVGLVSIITPCYNGERYLDRYFNSILSQTYPSVELIFVNDGSTDRTEEIALGYGEKLKARGYGYTYIFQANAGQSAAINQGLKIFKGEYLNWTDSDNYIPCDSIEKRVKYLEENPKIGVVIGRTEVVDDKDFKKEGIIQETGFNRVTPKMLAEDFLKGDSSCSCCCSTMVRSSMFRDSMPNPPQIETPREIGQNGQLFIPVMLKYPVKYVPDMFGYYVLHADSHSHQRKSFEQMMHIRDVSTQTLYSIADRLRIDDEELCSWFHSKIAEYDCKKRLEVMQHYRRSDGLDKVVAELKKMSCFDAVARKMVLKIKYPIIKKWSDKIWKLRNR